MPGMLKNLPLKATEKLLELFNNILFSGIVPDEWKRGNVLIQK